jgi:hypothetical protein
MVAKKGPKRLLIVEGGGDHNQALQAECREAFTRLQESAGVKERARVCPAGGRKAAYDKFCAELGKAGEGDRVVLLVDAEDVVIAKTRWQHVRTRFDDSWHQPEGTTEEHLHLMAVTMETWLLADPSSMKLVFEQRFDESKIPKWTSLESVPKSDINQALKTAITPRNDRDRGYDKGRHSFRALKHVSASTLESKCPSAKALFDTLRR